MQKLILCIEDFNNTQLMNKFFLWFKLHTNEKDINTNLSDIDCDDDVYSNVYANVMFQHFCQKFCTIPNESNQPVHIFTNEMLNFCCSVLQMNKNNRNYNNQDNSKQQKQENHVQIATRLLKRYFMKTNSEIYNCIYNLITQTQNMNWNKTMFDDEFSCILKWFENSQTKDSSFAANIILEKI